MDIINQYAYLPRHVEPSSFANAFCWLRSDLGITLVSGNVAAWADALGNASGTQSVVSRRPTLVPGFSDVNPGVGLGIYPALRIENNKWMPVGALQSAFNFLHNGSAWTAFFVGQKPALTGTQASVMFSSRGAAVSAIGIDFKWTAPGWGGSIGNGGAQPFTFSAGSGLAAGWHACCAAYDPTLRSIGTLVDNQATTTRNDLGSFSHSGAAPALWPSIGHPSTNNALLNSLVVEAIFYTRLLSLDERRRVMHALNNKYNFWAA